MSEGIILKRERLKCGFTLKEVAEKFELSKPYLSMLENGKKEVPKGRYELLMTYYEKHKKSAYLEAKFDWVRIRVPSHNVTFVIEKLLGMKKELFYSKPTGLYGYVEMFQYDNIRLLTSEKGDERGILIELSGQGCRNYDYVLNERSETWRDFFARCLIENGVFKRIDVAIDDYKEVVSLVKLARKVARGEYITSFKKCRSINSFQLSREESDGATIYFGTRQSLMYFCFYQKNYEVAARERIPVEEVDVKNRYELRFASEKAHKFIEHYMVDNDFARLILSVCGQHITFLEKDRNGGSHEWGDWKRFVGELDFVDLRVDPVKPSFNGKVRWLRQQVSKTMRVVQEVDSLRGTTVLQDIIDEAELETSEEKLIMWEMLENDELVQYENKLIVEETGQIFCELVTG